MVPGWILGSAPPQLPGVGTGVGWDWSQRQGGGGTSPGTCVATRAHYRNPPGTLLTSARGEHDGPADIILVVHVAFD